jgi:acyl carrier protein
MLQYLHYVGHNLQGNTMTRDEVKAVLLRVSKEKYKLDIDNFAEDASLAELKDLNPKVDSMAVIELIFDVEDELGIKVNNNDMSQPANLAEIIDSLTQAVNNKK